MAVLICFCFVVKCEPVSCYNSFSLLYSEWNTEPSSNIELGSLTRWKAECEAEEKCWNWLWCPEGTKTSIQDKDSSNLAINYIMAALFVSM